MLLGEKTFRRANLVEKYQLWKNQTMGKISVEEPEEKRWLKEIGMQVRTPEISFDKRHTRKTEMV